MSTDRNDLFDRIEVARANLALAYHCLDDPDVDLPRAVDQVISRRAKLAWLVAELRAVLRAGSLVTDRGDQSCP